MGDLGRMLVFVGGLLLVLGLVLILAGKINLPIGRLPGDIVIRGKNSTFYFPLMTSIVLSVILSLVLWVVEDEAVRTVTGNWSPEIERRRYFRASSFAFASAGTITFSLELCQERVPGCILERLQHPVVFARRSFEHANTLLRFQHAAFARERMVGRERVATVHAARCSASVMSAMMNRAMWARVAIGLC